MTPVQELATASRAENVSKSPSVTVVVPTRDRPALLERALRSVLSQRYDGSIECIVVFDQSEPSLPDLDVPAGASLRAIRNTRTPGLAGARNSGGMEAGGELLAFLDDDDEWLPGKLARQVACLTARPSAMTVATGIEIRYGDRSFVRVPESDTLEFRDLLLSRRADVHPSTFLIRRQEFLTRIGPVDEELPGSYAEDYEWLLRATRVAPVLTVREPLVRVYWHRSSYFADRWQMIAAALSHVLERYPDFRTEPRGYARIAGQIAFAHGAARRPRLARQWARRAFTANWREPRAYMALAVSMGVPADGLLRLAHLAGKGI